MKKNISIILLFLCQPCLGTNYELNSVPQVLVEIKMQSFSKNKIVGKLKNGKNISLPRFKIFKKLSVDRFNKFFEYKMTISQWKKAKITP